MRASHLKYSQHCAVSWCFKALMVCGELPPPPCLFGWGFVYSPAIITIAPSLSQSPQVNSLSRLIMPRNERRAWGGGGLEGESKGARQRETEEWRRKAFEWKREKEGAPTVLRALFGAQGQASTGSKRAPLCAVSTPPPANLQRGQGPHYSGGNWWAKPGGVGDDTGILPPQTFCWVMFLSDSMNNVCV